MWYQIYRRINSASPIVSEICIVQIYAAVLYLQLPECASSHITGFNKRWACICYDNAGNKEQKSLEIFTGSGACTESRFVLLNYFQGSSNGLSASTTKIIWGRGCVFESHSWSFWIKIKTDWSRLPLRRSCRFESYYPGFPCSSTDRTVFWMSIR